MRAAALGLALAFAACAPTTSQKGPAALAVQSAVSYDPSDPIRVAAIYRPAGERQGPLPWILAIHGGAFMSGSRFDCATYAADLGGEGYAVVSVEYHLTTEPGVTWPTPLRDCQAALRFFRSHAADFDLDPDRFAVMGGSAGGCLATRLGLEDDPAGPLGRARYVVDISGEQDLRLLDRCMSNHEQITTLLLGRPGPWTDAELLAPSNVGRARCDVDFFVCHGTANGDTYVENSDLLVPELRAAGAPVEYHRIEGGGMWAASSPDVQAALRSWLASRLR